jgi:hypothetical protein
VYFGHVRFDLVYFDQVYFDLASPGTSWTLDHRDDVDEDLRSPRL